MGVKIFVSHARDEYGKSHIPQVHLYSFSILYTLGDNFELRRQRSVHKRLKNVQALGVIIVL